MRNGEIMEESFGMKPYITKFNITQARTKLKYRTKMLQHDVTKDPRMFYGAQVTRN